MGKSGFYPKLAVSNIRKNSRFYLPYLLTCVATVAMFYIMSFIASNPGLQDMQGAGTISAMMGFGTVVIGIFATIILFYTNSFLIKRRKKELGLYNILGMGKRHIAKVLFFETVYVTVISLAGGLLGGILFSKLVFMLLLRLVDFKVTLGFNISLQAIQMTLVLFCAIFLLILLFNLFQIKLSKPIELLYGGNHGEREPKTKWPLVVIGILTLGGGYFLALYIKSPIAAIGMFFIAVILVIIGTYCLFTAGSIAWLKMLRRNKKYYYQPRHFSAVSGMLYRMKQNAAGLASICILCTMVLVMVSTSVCMYIGVEDALNLIYPRNVQIYLYECQDQAYQQMSTIVKEEVAKSGLDAYDMVSFQYYQEEDDWNRSLFIGNKMAEALTGEIPGDNGQDYPPNAYLGFNLPGSDGAPSQLLDAIRTRLTTELAGQYDTYESETRSLMAGNIYSAYGGFLFLGMFLGLLFLLATVLIIYYKQISEGYDDKQRFEIMKKVGMSRAETKATVRSQILTVFFLPLIVAVIHIAFAFKIITKLLAVLSLTDISLFISCTGVTILVFAIIYCLVYMFTAKVYYRIVS